MDYLTAMAPHPSIRDAEIREFQAHPARDPRIAAWLDDHHPTWREEQDLVVLSGWIADAVIEVCS